MHTQLAHTHYPLHHTPPGKASCIFSRFIEQSPILVKYEEVDQTVENLRVKKAKKKACEFTYLKQGLRSMVQIKNEKGLAFDPILLSILNKTNFMDIWCLRSVQLFQSTLGPINNDWRCVYETLQKQ